MRTAKDVVTALQKVATKERAAANRRFFKTGKGQYGEGDIFLGVTVPATRIVVKQAKDLPFEEIIILLESPLHEVRLCGALIFVVQFTQGGTTLRKKIYDEYVKRISTSINNWDLVDTTTPHIAGGWLADRPKTTLHKLARSKNLWERRVAILATLHFIRRQKQYDETFRIADMLMHDKEDLIHKATGWMLREVGNTGGLDVLEAYLLPRLGQMPRTMLRYAIEKFPKKRRTRLMTRPTA